MDLKALFAEILDAVVRHNKRKADTDKPNYYLNQKKQHHFIHIESADHD